MFSMYQGMRHAPLADTHIPNCRVAYEYLFVTKNDLLV